MPDPSDLLRALNVALALYVLAQAARPRAIRWWRALPLELRFLQLGLLGLVFAPTWGTVETLVQALPGGSRIPIFTIALAWTAIGITLLHARLRKDPPS